MTGNHVANYRDGALYEVGTDVRITYVKSTDIFSPPNSPVA